MHRSKSSTPCNPPLTPTLSPNGERERTAFAARSCNYCATTPSGAVSSLKAAASKARV
jgi:hypothetical protein